MSPAEVQDLLCRAFSALLVDEDDLPEIIVCTFEEAGILTKNKGIVLEIDGPDGDEFQITIVRS